MHDVLRRSLLFALFIEQLSLRTLGREGKGREGREEGERGGDVEEPGKWSAPGPVLALSVIENDMWLI